MSSTDVRDDPRTDYPTRKAEPAREQSQNEARPRGEQRSVDRNDFAHNQPVNHEHVQNEPRSRDYEQHEHADRGTSWTSVILGWLTSMGAGVILAGIVSGIVGAMLGVGATPRAAATEGGMAGLVGLLITLFLAFLMATAPRAWRAALASSMVCSCRLSHWWLP